MENYFARAQALFPGLTDTDLRQVALALDLVDRAVEQNPLHQTSIRPKGEDVATILMAVHIDLESIIAALLSDSRMEGQLDQTAINQQFGPVVASLVQDVQWLNKVSIYSPEMANQPNQSEILRRMLLAMTHDVRAVLIKLAFRIQRLRGLGREEDDIRRFIARETLDIYAPLANRLGISQFKWELEDLAFRYLEPEQYRDIAQSLADSRGQRETCIAEFLQTLRDVLALHNIQAKVYGRVNN